MKTNPQALLTAALLSLLSACSQQNLVGPPTVRYGQDACADCGMILSDDRFAAAIINPAPDAPPLLFDDAGCLLAYQRKHPESTPWTHYFHDADTHAWITQDHAFFVKTTRETPMGSGIFAFGSRTAAEALAQSNNTTPQTFAEISQHDPITAAASQ
ncbi:MAG: nitrous oxide reductase accessory protein NosL [Phycisphaerae bacterium]